MSRAIAPLPQQAHPGRGRARGCGDRGPVGRARARAEEDASRIAEAAQRSIRDETDRARQVLRREVAELSVGLAREKLSASVTSDDQDRLAGDFIDTVQGKNGAANG